MGTIFDELPSHNDSSTGAEDGSDDENVNITLVLKMKFRDEMKTFLTVLMIVLTIQPRELLMLVMMLCL